jgi:ribonuclease R
MTSPSGPWTGPIAVTRTGKGFFSIDPEQDDLFIPDGNLGGAFPGDIVTVEAAGTERDPKSGQQRPVGKVTSIVSRNRATFVGKLVPGTEVGQNPADTYLLPDWKKMYTPILVRGESLPHGQKVVVRFTQWLAGAAYPEGTLEEIIGPAGAHETEMRALALGSGFRSDFPPGVVHESTDLEERGKAMLAEEAASAVAAGTRRDFRTITTFTIDPYNAKDFDDALSLQTLPNGNVELGVHIADVSFFVRPGTSIDTEARTRATSVYLVDRTIPMLPEVLSTDLCSLNPNEDRLAMSAVFELDAEGAVVGRWFGSTVIHSDRRFTYENAQEILTAGVGEYADELVAMNRLAKIMRKRREEMGAIAFETPEVKIDLDETGTPIAVRLKDRMDTNLLIEEYMLLANREVAAYLTEEVKNAHLSQQPIYRIHDAPDADRIMNLASFLSVLGYDLKQTHGKVTGQDLNKLLASVVGKPEEYLIKVAALRSMSKAIYSTKNIGHLPFTQVIERLMRQRQSGTPSR